MAQHLAFPIAVAVDGKLAAFDQDSPAEIAQSVALLLATEPGERTAVPDYGYPSPIGRGIDPDEIADLIEEHEDRADPALVEVTLNTLVEQRAAVLPSVPAAVTTTTDEEN